MGNRPAIGRFTSDTARDEQNASKTSGFGFDLGFECIVSKRTRLRTQIELIEP
jgi:hypothetical protein